MSLQVQNLALEAIASLRPLMPLIRRSDHFSAAGSANEARAALRVAIIWGYVAEGRAAEAERVLDRVVAMLWRLTHPRR